MRARRIAVFMFIKHNNRVFQPKILADLFSDNGTDSAALRRALELINDPSIAQAVNQMAAEFSLPLDIPNEQSPFQREIAEKNIKEIEHFIDEHQIYGRDFLIKLLKSTLKELESKKIFKEKSEMDELKIREKVKRDFSALGLPVSEESFSTKKAPLDYSREFLKKLSRWEDFLNFFKKYLSTEFDEAARAIVYKILASHSARNHIHEHLQIMEWIVSDKRNLFSDLILYTNYITDDLEHIIQMHSDQVLAMFTALLQSQKDKFSEVFAAYFQMQKRVGDHDSTYILRTLIESNTGIPLKELSQIFSLYFEAKEVKRTAQDNDNLMKMLKVYFNLYRYAFKKPVKNPAELQQRFIDLDFVDDFAFYLEKKAGMDRKQIVKGLGFDLERPDSKYWLFGGPSFYLESIIENSKLTDLKKKRLRKVLNLYLKNFQKYLMSFRLLNLLKRKKEIATIYTKGLACLKTDQGTAAYPIKLDYSYLFESFYDFVHYVPYLEKEGPLKPYEEQVFKILEKSFKQKEFKTVEELAAHFENLTHILRNMFYAIDRTYGHNVLNLLEELIDRGEIYNWELVKNLIKPEWKPSAGKKMILSQDLLDKLNLKRK